MADETEATETKVSKPAHKMTLAEVEAEIKQLELEDMKLRLEETRDRVEGTKAAKEVRSRQNRQRQAQLRTDLRERVEVINTCTHKQGGSPGRERKGSGPSALRVVILPDGRSLVMCANCPLRVFSPFPRLGYQGQYRGESKAQANKRLAKYAEDVKKFEELVTASENQLTPEAAAPMHCGKQFAFQDGMGNNLSMPAPCDSYAQGTDNRNVA